MRNNAFIFPSNKSLVSVYIFLHFVDLYITRWYRRIYARNFFTIVQWFFFEMKLAERCAHSYKIAICKCAQKLCSNFPLFEIIIFSCHLFHNLQVYRKVCSKEIAFIRKMLQISTALCSQILHEWSGCGHIWPKIYVVKFFLRSMEACMFHLSRHAWSHVVCWVVHVILHLFATKNMCSVCCSFLFVNVICEIKCGITGVDQLIYQWIQQSFFSAEIARLSLTWVFISKILGAFLAHKKVLEFFRFASYLVMCLQIEYQISWFKCLTNFRFIVTRTRGISIIIQCLTVLRLALTKLDGTVNSESVLFF